VTATVRYVYGGSLDQRPWRFHVTRSLAEAWSTRQNIGVGRWGSEVLTLLDDHVTVVGAESPDLEPHRWRRTSCHGARSLGRGETGPIIGTNTGRVFRYVSGTIRELWQAKRPITSIMPVNGGLLVYELEGPLTFLAPA
jgi:hypothetical protein